MNDKGKKSQPMAYVTYITPFVKDLRVSGWTVGGVDDAAQIRQVKDS